MNNSEELATLCTQDTGVRQKEKQKTTKKIKKISNTNPTAKPGE